MKNKVNVERGAKHYSMAAAIHAFTHRHKEIRKRDSIFRFWS